MSSKEYQDQYNKSYYAENKERLIRQSKEYQDKNKLSIKERRKQFYGENAERLRAKSVLYRKQNREKVLKRDAKYRWTWQFKYNMWKNGARRGHKNPLEFNLTLEELQQIPLICAYTGIPLTLEPSKANSVSLDRIDSSKGYIRGNVCFTTREINIMKKNLDVDYFIKLCGSISSYRTNKIDQSV